jgi:hypothetical protein
MCGRTERVKFTVSIFSDTENNTTATSQNME